MATKRGKSQARRTAGNRGGMPGWAWLVLGIVLAVAVILIAPKVMKTRNGDGFFRPRPNPDAQPASSSDGEEDVAAGDGNALPSPATRSDAKPTRYDFYKMLPGNEVQMSDAEIAAIARDEAARKGAGSRPPPSATGAAAAGAPATGAPATTPAPVAAPSASTTDAPYLLQAGAFAAPADAEATKARVALLGLSARVESARINARTVYRVRMGPYSTAAELAEAKRKLANGGLPAMAIKAR